MKKREQKGFTIVELVIVIAVIAVLATVLVPTFGDLIGRAQAAAATQQVANAYKEALVKAKPHPLIFKIYRPQAKRKSRYRGVVITL